MFIFLAKFRLKTQKIKNSRFFLSLKSKACRLAPLNHSLEEALIHVCLFVHIGVAKSKMYFQKKQEFCRGGGLTIMEFWGHGGVMHFGISEGKWGLTWKPSVVGYGYCSIYNSNWKQNMKERRECWANKWIIFLQIWFYPFWIHTVHIRF